MNTSSKYILLIPVIIFLAGCDSPDISKDFTAENLFTNGIEGPAVDSENNLYAVNFEKEGTIGIVDMEGNASLYVTLPNGSIGNGIRFDQEGNMYIADYINHNVLQIKKGSKEVSVYAHHEDLNQPNDLAISPDGTLYASDPNWKDGTGKIWKVTETGFHLLDDDMGTTNGIEVSPDGKRLYVNESVQRIVWVYDIDADGNPVRKREFFRFEDFGMDGMRCDARGNLYICRYDAGTVVVIDPEGTLIREIQLKGKKPSNITFGGKNGDQCFVTLQDRGCIETFTADFPGKGF